MDYAARVRTVLGGGLDTPAVPATFTPGFRPTPAPPWTPPAATAFVDALDSLPAAANGSFARDARACLKFFRAVDSRRL